MREFDPSIMTADPSSSNQAEGSTSAEATQNEQNADISTDPFASYFNSINDPTLPPKVLITTSFKASKPTYEFCDELVGVFPGAEFRRRKKGKGFEMGRIAGWAADRGYKHLLVVNEDMKKPSTPSTFAFFLIPLSDLVFSRCYHYGPSPERSDSVFQAHVG
jgi:ribosome production factor 1